MVNKRLLGIANRLGNEELELDTQSRSTEPFSLESVDEGDYVYMPQHKLYVAKERTHLAKNWHNSHHDLHIEGARMLTIREFIDFLSLLKNGNKEFKEIYNEITEAKDPWRSEWLDADFRIMDNGLHINYNHRTNLGGHSLGHINSELIPQNSELLETCLMKDCIIDIGSFNRQGLPTKKGSDFKYWYPRSEDYSVAGFEAGSGRNSLDYDKNPRSWSHSLGVRAVRKKV